MKDEPDQNNYAPFNLTDDGLGSCDTINLFIYSLSSLNSNQNKSVGKHNLD